MKILDKQLALQFSKGQEEAFQAVRTLYYPRIFKSNLQIIGYRAAARLITEDVFEDLWRLRVTFKTPASIDFFLQQHSGDLSRLYILCAAREIELALGDTIDLKMGASLSFPIPFDAARYDRERVAKTGIIDKFTTNFFYLNVLKKEPLQITAQSLGVSANKLGGRLLVALHLLHINFLAYLNDIRDTPNLQSNN